MARGRKSSLKVALSDYEHQYLQKIVRSNTVPACLPVGTAGRQAVPNGQARRARSILMLAEGLPITHIATMVGMAPRHVRNWGRRFIKKRVLHLKDLPRTGRPPVFSPRSSHTYC